LPAHVCKYCVGEEPGIGVHIVPRPSQTRPIPGWKVDKLANQVYIPRPNRTCKSVLPAPSWADNNKPRHPTA
jgi:hypothetical protein